MGHIMEDWDDDWNIPMLETKTEKPKKPTPRDKRNR
jgi:hypothetical protein